MGNPDPNGDVWYDVSSKAKCEIVEQATAALLRYLERLPFTTNTAWPVVRRCWSEAPARFDELDKRQAGAQIATRDSIATFDGVRHTDHEEAGVWREAQASILYEDDRDGNLQQCAADNLVRQHHLTSTLSLIIAQRTDPLAARSGVTQVRTLCAMEPR